LIRVYQEEGTRRLFSGASTATGRAVLMTVGQLSFYDQVKLLLLRAGFSDNLVTHFLSSLTAVSNVLEPFLAYMAATLRITELQNFSSHMLLENLRFRYIK
jgi:hypothetical protein